MRRAEGGEIVEADQLLAAACISSEIERPATCHDSPLFPGQRRTAVDDAIFITTARSGKARVPVVGDDLAPTTAIGAGRSCAFSASVSLNGVSGFSISRCARIAMAEPRRRCARR